MASKLNLPLLGFLLFLVIPTYWVRAQNLENIDKEKPVSISGGVQLNAMGYTVKGINSRRAPFTWIGTGNLNIDLYGWSVPLSFSYTNHQGNFQQPFNRYGISPTYKWAKAYVGYHSLTYSAYTLNGHVFLGGGLELTPGKYRINAMYGRFQKAVAADTQAGAAKPPVYQRQGMALKTGYGAAKGSIDAIVFYAADDKNSLPQVPDSLSVFPAQNTALSLIAKKQLGKRLTMDAEWATSLFTRDQTAARVSQPSGIKRIGAKLMPMRESTTAHQAFKGGLTLALNKGFIQGRYERVDPDYQTLGAYFFSNDLENITLGAGWQFWQNRLQLNAQGGIQHNNLDQTDISQTRRWVSNYTANLLPTDRWQFTTTYSNFTSFTNIRPQADPFFSTEFDSLNFYQVNQNASLLMSYAFGTKERKGNIVLSSTYQQVTETTQDSLSARQASFYYSNNASYRINYVPLNLAISIGGNLHYNLLGLISTTTWGPLLSINKSLMEKKMRGTFSTGLNQVITNKLATNRVMTARFNTSYSPAKSHQVSLNINFLNNYPVEQQHSFLEWTATARYGYTF